VITSASVPTWLPSNPYACKRGSREEKEKEIWAEANVYQFVRARSSALQDHMPNPDNLFPTGKRRFTKKALKDGGGMAGGGGQAPKPKSCRIQ